ncbi:hypothetical protein KZZ52_33755 [Dactylosporangium sp. AC04546]|uniref:hypothetical protein n=1 Tax=Dactylosporangium sp. AC04546 TaxID=2862460 RepID=UPI001EDD6D99|nr:hypothetical protein [Dactylosporangium sp. AC04546]WVK78941.1 hypothetical protein KZZ52_33755 [Dactylosporangium sp. AC04546]
MEIVLVLIVGLICGVVGYSLGVRNRPRLQQLQAADAVARFLRAVEASRLAPETVRAVKHVAFDTYDAATAAYILGRLRKAQSGNE